MSVPQFRTIVCGRVQGVYFRAGTRDEARRLGLAGYARNRADGSVEVVAEGPRELLDSLLAYLRTGPPAARVDHIEVEWTSDLDAPRPFTIRR